MSAPRDVDGPGLRDTDRNGRGSDDLDGVATVMRTAPTEASYGASQTVDRECTCDVALERYLGSGTASLDEEPFRSAAATLFSTWRGCENAAATASAARETIDALAQGARSGAVSDERSLRAVAYIKSHLDRPLTLEQVADEACLSPSRFRHLFVEQTGLRCVPVSCGAVSSSRGRS